MAQLTVPFKASGTTLSYKYGASSVYAALLQLVEVNLDGIEVAKIDTTVLAALVKSCIPSIPDSGTVTLKVLNVPADVGNIQIRTSVNAPSVGAWQLQYPDGSTSTTGSTETFSAWVQKVAPGGFAIDGTPVLDVTLQVTGLITTAQGT